MARPVDRIAERLCVASVTHPRWVIGIAAILFGLLLVQASRVTNEVGYAAYFGPDDPSVERLSDFLDEFDGGLHILVVLSCVDSRLCERIDEPQALALLGRMQSQIDAMPNVRRTTSLLDAPIVVGPLETRSVARRTLEGDYELEGDWRELVERALDERFLVNTVISPDARTAGLVVELQSLHSEPVRDIVHRIRDATPAYEAELGGEIYLAGDPIWSVLSDDDLNSDSTRLILLMFLVILGILWGLFRNLSLTLLPVLAVGMLTVAVHGLIGAFSIPMTSILAALPPVLVVIAITASIHLLTAWVRIVSTAPERLGIGEALVEAARQVGSGCFWASATTIGGFGSFLWSDLASFRNFGLMAALGILLAFVLTFTLLPALLVLRPKRFEHPAVHHPRILRDVLALIFQAVTRRSGFVLAASVVVLLLVAAGLPRLEYRVHLGDQSFVLRSVRFVESNFRKPMTTELVVSVPEGKRVYDESTLRLLARVEGFFASESSTGYVWSFLDFLEEAYRIDRGVEASSLEEVIAGVPSAMPIVAGQESVASFWNETLVENGEGPAHYLDRARVSVDRAWLDDQTQTPYLERVNAYLRDLNQEVAAEGFRVELEGGLPLNELAIERIRGTQLSSFLSAFAVVAVCLVLLLRRDPTLLGWALFVNMLPVVSVLGLMGWGGIGVDPANTMVAAILLAIAVDDTIHIAIRFLRERARGVATGEALRICFETVGEAVVVTTVCLALGFSVLMFSRWGGLVSFGMLASAGVIFALLADLLIFPAALLRRTRGSPATAKAQG